WARTFSPWRFSRRAITACSVGSRRASSMATSTALRRSSERRPLAHSSDDASGVASSAGCGRADGAARRAGLRRLTPSFRVRRPRHLARHLRDSVLDPPGTGSPRDGAGWGANALPADRQLRAERRSLPSAPARTLHRRRPRGRDAGGRLVPAVLPLSRAGHTVSAGRDSFPEPERRALRLLRTR